MKTSGLLDITASLKTDRFFPPFAGIPPGARPNTQSSTPRPQTWLSRWQTTDWAAGLQSIAFSSLAGLPPRARPLGPLSTPRRWTWVPAADYRRGGRAQKHCFFLHCRLAPQGPPPRAVDDATGAPWPLLRAGSTRVDDQLESPLARPKATRIQLHPSLQLLVYNPC